MVIVSIDQHRQIITRSAVVLKGEDITEVGAICGPVCIHCDNDVVAVLREFHEVVYIAAGIEIPIEQSLEVDLVSLCCVVIDDVVYVRRTGFSEDKRIRARTTDQFIVADPADQDVVAVAAHQEVVTAAAGKDVISSPPQHQLVEVFRLVDIFQICPHIPGSRAIGRIAEHRTRTAAEHDIPEIERIAVVEPGDGAGEDVNPGGQGKSPFPP